MNSANSTVYQKLEKSKDNIFGSLLDAPPASEATLHEKPYLTWNIFHSEDL